MASIRARLRRRRRSERGAELIELAIVLPILLFVLAAMIDFGFLFQQYEVVNNAAREGARLASLPNYTDTDVIARVQSYLAASGLNDPAAPTPTVTAGTLSLSAGGPVISVRTVTVRYPANFMYLGPFAALVGGTAQSQIMLQAVSSMRTETAMGGS